MSAYPWLNVLNTRSIRSGDSARLVTTATETARVCTRVIAPSTLVLLALGIIMVVINDAWTIGQLWIILALVLWRIRRFGAGSAGSSSWPASTS